MTNILLRSWPSVGVGAVGFFSGGLAGSTGFSAGFDATPPGNIPSPMPPPVDVGGLFFRGGGAGLLRRGVPAFGLLLAISRIFASRSAISS